MNSLQTSRLLLKTLKDTDAQALYPLASNEDVARYMRFETHRCLEETERFVRGYLEEMEHASCRAFTIVVQENKETAGFFALKQDQDDPGVYSMSIFLGKEHWGKGYFQEILSTAEPFAFDSLGASRLTAYVVEENTGSRRALEKRGYRTQTIHTYPGAKLYVYCLSKEDLKK